MTLNQKSFHAILYKFFYSVESLPDNLCPYFWKLVVAIFWLALFLVGYFIFNYHLVRYWLNCYSYSSDRALQAGMADLCIIAILAGHFFATWRNNRKSRHRYEEAEPKQYIIIEYAKGFYGKYCPKITWK